MSGTLTVSVEPMSARNNLLRVGTRGSDLAVAQTTTVAQALARATGCDVHVMTVTTQGDLSSTSLAQLGGQGVFATALRQALQENQCDLVVHSLKDLPTQPCDGLTIGAIPKRVDARDALCARDALTFDQLPAGARVGTGSPRRIAQIAQNRSDLDVVDLRGNVDSRLARVANGDLDAVVLAAAGLSRLDRLSSVTDFFDLSEMPTAPGQGALALEVRSSDCAGQGTIARALASVNHVTTRACVFAERQVLSELGVGCAAPLGASAVVDDGLLFLTATLYALDGSESISASHAATPNSLSAADLADAARDVGTRVAGELRQTGSRFLESNEVTS